MDVIGTVLCRWAEVLLDALHLLLIVAQVQRSWTPANYTPKRYDAVHSCLQALGLSYTSDIVLDLSEPPRGLCGLRSLGLDIRVLYDANPPCLLTALTRLHLCCGEDMDGFDCDIYEKLRSLSQLRWLTADNSVAEAMGSVESLEEFASFLRDMPRVGFNAPCDYLLPLASDSVSWDMVS